MTGIGIFNKAFFSMKSGDDLVKEHVRRIISTSFGERVGNIAFGTNLRNYIFNSENYFLEDVRSNLITNIEGNEPSVTVSNITITRVDERSYSIYIEFVNNETTTEISLEAVMLTD